MPLILLLLPVLSTLAGGLLALRFRRFGSALLALAAGLLLGAAFLDLLPEAITAGAVTAIPTATILGWTLVSFLLFSIADSWLDRLAGTAATASGIPEDGGPGSQRKGLLGGAMLVFHSFRDGMAIGAAYAVSHPMGYAVALGIIVHDLGDGMNTVLVTTRDRVAGPVTYAFLAADALAPLAGGLLTVWWAMGSGPTAILLALSAGFFIQMATSEFLPQIRLERRRSALLYGLVLLGAGILYGANRLLGL